MAKKSGRGALSFAELAALDYVIEQARARGIKPHAPAGFINDIQETIETTEITETLEAVGGLAEGDPKAAAQAIKRVRAALQSSLKPTLKQLMDIRRQALAARRG